MPERFRNITSLHGHSADRSKRIGRLLLMVRMVLGVGAFQRLKAHAQEAGRLPLVDATLHEPGRGGVTERVRRDAHKAGATAGRVEGRLDVLDRLAVAVNDEADV